MESWTYGGEGAIVTHLVTINSLPVPRDPMRVDIDPGLTALFGSRARLLTLAVLANADEPLTGYRVAKIAGVPRQKVYPELRRGVATGLLERSGDGFRLSDSDIRAILRKRVRIRWDAEWDRARVSRAVKVASELGQIRASLKGVETYDPTNRIPVEALRELERDPEKNRVLRRLGLRPSLRKD
jgi:hypothetical protein